MCSWTHTLQSPSARGQPVLDCQLLPSPRLIALQQQHAINRCSAATRLEARSHCLARDKHNSCAGHMALQRKRKAMAQCSSKGHHHRRSHMLGEPSLVLLQSAGSPLLGDGHAGECFSRGLGGQRLQLSVNSLQRL